MKLKASVHNILPLPAAITGYATGLQKLLANWEFFVGAQVEVSL